MQIMIHACPERLWYVNEFLVPSLLGQGIERERIEICEDKTRRGNLAACMEIFRSCTGDGGAWHLQDDVLICRDFAARIRALPKDKIICGFVSELGGPDCNLRGEVYAADMWYSFPCIFIPHELARECSEWFFSKAWQREADPAAGALAADNRGDDFFFREFMEINHGMETVINLRPCLVDHVDWILGGSVVNPFRGCQTRAVYWDDNALITELKNQIIEFERRSP